jgi:RNA polymerase sigma factor (sigma-70 family)
MNVLQGSKVMATSKCTVSTNDLACAARAGDRVAMDRLVNRYANVVWGSVRAFRLCDADAHDAVQNTWLRMIEHLGDLRDAERLPGWLATTARREALKILRSGRRERVGLDPGESESVDRSTPGPEAHVIDNAMHELLWNQVADLPAAGREMVTVLTAADAPSYGDYARLSAMPIGSVGPRRMRYLRQLRRSLEHSGLGQQAWR